MVVFATGRRAARDGNGPAVDQDISGRVATNLDRVGGVVAECSEQMRGSEKDAGDSHNRKLLVSWRIRRRPR
jgi:hypothetical protein